MNPAHTQHSAVCTHASACFTPKPSMTSLFFLLQIGTFAAWRILLRDFPLLSSKCQPFHHTEGSASTQGREADTVTQDVHEWMHTYFCMVIQSALQFRAVSLYYPFTVSFQKFTVYKRNGPFEIVCLKIQQRAL